MFAFDEFSTVHQMSNRLLRVRDARRELTHGEVGQSGVPRPNRTLRPHEVFWGTVRNDLGSGAEVIVVRDDRLALVYGSDDRMR